MNIFSAFAPTSGIRGWYGGNASDVSATFSDVYNNWWPSIPEEDMNITTWWNPNFHSYRNATDSADSVPYTPQQIYIQTADQAIVCTMGNASFDVDFTFVDGVQVQSDYLVTDFEPYWTPLSGGHTSYYLDTNNNDTYEPEDFRELNSYMGIYVAFTSLLNGNVTTTLSNAADANKEWDVVRFDGNAIVGDYTSESLKNGLSACPEYAHGSVSQSLVILL
jgi:hypothetical protein